MTSDRLGAEWRVYRTKVIPLAAPAIQATECRRAFYSGAGAMFNLLMASVRAGDEEPAQDELARVADLEGELDSFFAALKEGRA